MMILIMLTMMVMMLAMRNKLLSWDKCGIVVQSALDYPLSAELKDDDDDGVGDDGGGENDHGAVSEKAAFLFKVFLFFGNWWYFLAIKVVLAEHMMI